MKTNIKLRAARNEDYSGFRKMEEEAWAGTGVDIISEEMFRTWIKVFPEGLRLALVNGEVCGHIYSQICDFDPFDESDQRNLYTMTDDMYTIKTHNPGGDCVYSFSISATNGRMASELVEYSLRLTENLGKRYLTGPMRMSGLDRYADKKGIKILTKEVVTRYAKTVNDTIRRKRKGKSKVFDPILSTILNVRKNESGCARVIENCFPFPGSQSWGCILYYENKKFKQKLPN